ncbi:hypothetical protein GCG54_00002446 [Colletotrichum gloeosporioides]|uniref:F-box domain-containing protein n=1 Tax=Colletotrichum gloeosporioides TaxID=474922 RepID=A0A8H4CUE2_COLGL|nr:uncharacterized protein GCG54_00002446 [Colletotrichum gloeosporioides]KAF3809997.1 hypothetical protein GCG54_00002446 [Colletotrichum gloeosporioides]
MNSQTKLPSGSLVIDFIANSPFEIAALVFSHIDNIDIKNLRLSCKKLANLASPHLRFKRVFIGASPLNVEVFRAVAEHETFRHDVREIVWDESRYETPDSRDRRYQGDWDLLNEGSEHSSDEENDEEDNEDRPWIKYPRGLPFWFYRCYHATIENLEDRRQEDVKTLPQHLETSKQLATGMPIQDAYAHYLKLLKEQEQVLSNTSADAVAFEWALNNDRFPNLKRVTLTPAAHGMLFNPLYPTPAIRALPDGFIYPLPRGWPTPLHGEEFDGWDWNDKIVKTFPVGHPKETYMEVKDKWRGFRHVVRVLAQPTSTGITELIFDGNQISTGLPCAIFNSPEPEVDAVEYENLIAIIKNPGFTTLKLNLMMDDQGYIGYGAFRNGRLKQALEAASDLRYFILETDQEDNPEELWRAQSSTIDHFIPLRSIFPIETWKNLSHFGLSRFLVKQEDLLDFLTTLPQTLRSVELSFLWFAKDSGNYRELLFGIRDTLDWQRRATRPRLLIRDEGEFQALPGRAVWLEDDLDEFLYSNGENPYVLPSALPQIMSFMPHAPEGLLPTPTVGYGFGRHKDAFEPRFERPYESVAELT